MPHVLFYLRSIYRSRNGSPAHRQFLPSDKLELEPFPVPKVDMAFFQEFRRHILPTVIRPMRVVWNQSMAFLFFVIASLAGFMVYREFTSRKDMDALLALVLGGFFVLLMAGYGLHSLLRARRASRS
jgi:hypothetical protein